MEIEQKPFFYLWRSVQDKDNFFLGTRTNTRPTRYLAWTSIFIDGIQECFGREVYEKCKRLNADEELEVGYSQFAVRIISNPE